jgi:MFS family permease
MFATLRRRDFGLLWLGGLISLTGDWMLNIALPVYVYTVTHSALATSLMAIAAFLPQPLLGSVAGVFVDRWSRKRTVVLCNLLMMLGLLPLLLAHTASSLWIIYPVLLGESVLVQFFRAAESALLPTLVGEDLRVPANALNGLSQHLSRLVGPAIGGIVVGLAGLRGVIIADAASFCVAAALIAPIRAPSHPVDVAPATERSSADASGAPATVPGAAPSVRREWLEGLALVRRKRVLSTIFLMLVATGLGEGIFGVLLVVFVVQVLQGGALQLGWTMSAQAIGGVLGGLVIGGLGRRFRPARLLGWAAVIFGILDLLIVDAPALLALGGAAGQATPVPGVALVLAIILLLFALVGIPGAAIQASVMTLVQAAAPNRLLGRVMGLLFALMALTTLLGMGIAGALGDRVGPVPLLNAQGSAYVLAGLLALARLRDIGRATELNAVGLAGVEASVLTSDMR